MKTVYLAGPTVFLADAEERFARMKDILSRYELQGKAPLDNQVGLEKVSAGRDLGQSDLGQSDLGQSDLGQSDLGQAIYDADESLMNSVDAAIFNTDPFRRGTEMDAGTAFEVGYCRARKLPMAAWRTDLRFYPETVQHFMDAVFQSALAPATKTAKGGMSGHLRDPDGVLVHSSGYYQNLMIDVAIRKSGGETYADENWEIAFDRAASRIAEIFRLASSSQEG